MMSERDEIARLFAETPPPPPPRDVGGRARARLRAIAGARRLTAVAAVAVAGLITLIVVAFLLGASLAESEAPVLVRLALEDRALAFEAREELSAAIIAATPWPYLLVAALNALALYLLVAYLLRATAQLGEGPEARR
jgi:hypothetical protein